PSTIIHLSTNSSLMTIRDVPAEKGLQPVLAGFLGDEANPGEPCGLDKITAMDGFGEGLKEIKEREKLQKSEFPTVKLRRESSVSTRPAAGAGLGGGVCRVLMWNGASKNGGPVDMREMGRTGRCTSRGPGAEKVNGGAIKSNGDTSREGGDAAVENEQEAVNEVKHGVVQVLGTRQYY
ncbi:unnamed protein product, partial [Rhizoctonia solani]